MKARILTSAVAAVLLLGGCVEINTDSGTDAGSTDHNAADVTFAQDMIPHHQQALVMADVAIEGAQTQELRDLAERIKAAQAPEIDQMTSWLEAWGEDVPDLDAMSHMMMGHGDDDELNDMPGMMDADQMQRMTQMMGGGRAFDEMWVRMMIAAPRGGDRDGPGGAVVRAVPGRDHARRGHRVRPDCRDRRDEADAPRLELTQAPATCWICGVIGPQNLHVAGVGAVSACAPRPSSWR